MANASAIWQHTAHNIAQLSSATISTGAIPKTHLRRMGQSAEKKRKKDETKRTTGVGRGTKEVGLEGWGQS